MVYKNIWIKLPVKTYTIGNESIIILPWCAIKNKLLSILIYGYMEKCLCSWRNVICNIKTVKFLKLCRKIINMKFNVCETWALPLETLQFHGKWLNFTISTSLEWKSIQFGILFFPSFLKSTFHPLPNSHTHTHTQDKGKYIWLLT